MTIPKLNPSQFANWPVTSHPGINLLAAIGPVLVWAGLIFWLSAQEVLPGFELMTAEFIWKKSAHLTVYAILYLLIERGLGRLAIPARHYWWLGLVIGSLYAISDEYHQSLVPGRTATIRDLGFDFMGMSLAFLKQARYW